MPNAACRGEACSLSIERICMTAAAPSMAAVCVKVMRVHTSRHRHENATAAAVPSHSGRPALTKHCIRPFAHIHTDRHSKAI